MECCVIPEGQIMRKQVPPEKTKDVLDFATKKPQERLASIRNGLGVLAYGQSEYVRVSAEVLLLRLSVSHYFSNSACIWPRMWGLSRFRPASSNLPSCNMARGAGN